ncbi:hypothetical protein [uncultured Cedecea sp.]|uniref:hypothetical protein n=1 Tax=uncultured Cedecea sp. TaxID=988762 RepID=UPI0026176543|nr:hypothetical protein [uncultured Cedecea sp.]
MVHGNSYVGLNKINLGNTGKPGNDIIKNNYNEQSGIRGGMTGIKNTVENKNDRTIYSPDPEATGISTKKKFAEVCTYWLHYSGYCRSTYYGPSYSKKIKCWQSFRKYASSSPFSHPCFN